MKRERAKTLGVAGAAAWIDDRTEDDPDFGEVTFPELLADCRAWHEDRALPPPSRQALGTALARRYVKRYVTSRTTLWALRLKPHPPGGDRIDSPTAPSRSAPADRTVVSEDGHAESDA